MQNIVCLFCSVLGNSSVIWNSEHRPAPPPFKAKKGPSEGSKAGPPLGPCWKCPRSRGPVSRPVSALPPVATVGEAAGQLQLGGGGAVPGHPRWGALHGRWPWALQDLRCGGELWEPEGLPLRQAHRLQWFHNKVSRCWFFTDSYKNVSFSLSCGCMKWTLWILDLEENQTVKRLENVIFEKWRKQWWKDL